MHARRELVPNRREGVTPFKGLGGKPADGIVERGDEGGEHFLLEVGRRGLGSL